VRTYRNPVHDGYFADPFVLRLEDRYVAYGTGSTVDGRVFEVLESPDLATWTRVGGGLEPLDPGLGADYWAPEVAQADGRFWMYYSVGHGDAGHHLRVAVAEAAAGPFLDLGVNLTPDEPFAIDPHPFRDDDGIWYLFFARDVLDAERVGTQLAVADLTGMTSLGPTTTVLAPSADWQIYERDRPMYGARYDWHTLEGPTVRRHGDRCYCLYSGGSWRDESYGVSWASAPGPLGPWTGASTDDRLLRTVPGHVRGPGHNSVVTTFGGTDMLVYHAWDEAQNARQLCIDPLVWTDEGPSTPGPTWDEQPLPD
jgi:arabinan endo-1,5-alpha-L-arabinosidase